MSKNASFIFLYPLQHHFCASVCLREKYLKGIKINLVYFRKWPDHLVTKDVNAFLIGQVGVYVWTFYKVYNKIINYDIRSVFVENKAQDCSWSSVLAVVRGFQCLSSPHVLFSNLNINSFEDLMC